MRRTHIAVVGAGASGLMAARQAAEVLQKRGEPVSVTLLEGNSRAGKKLLATGNGRCNLTNEEASPAHYHGDAELREILSCVSVCQVIRAFEQLGILCRTDEAGRVYPYNLQAAAVLKALRLACEESGVRFQYESNVFSILHTADGFLLKSENGEELLADKCILACGGQASPKHSCGTNGYELARQTGHRLVPLSPALVPVRCKEKALVSLKGMRCKAAVSLETDGDVLYRESGEVIFGEHSLSGICIFNLSVLLADYFRFGKISGQACKRPSIVLDLAEDFEAYELNRYLTKLCRQFPNRMAGDLLSGLLNNQVGEELLRSLQIDRAKPFSALTNEELARIVSVVKAWHFSAERLEGWEKAQVTAGGVSLREIQTNTMESRKVPGLYITGELLNVHGDCGGYNLHFAWISGMLAGRSAAENIILV